MFHFLNCIRKCIETLFIEYLSMLLDVFRTFFYVCWFVFGTGKGFFDFDSYQEYMDASCKFFEDDE